MKTYSRSLSHAIYNIQLHIVFVTKYRREILTQELHASLRQSLEVCLAAWRCRLIEFSGQNNHIHFLIEIHPAVDISVLINNLKTTSARRARAQFAEHIALFYRQPVFWHRAYFVTSVGESAEGEILDYVHSLADEDRAGRTTTGQTL